MPSAEEEVAEVPKVDHIRQELLEEVKNQLGSAVIGEHLSPGKDLWVRVQTQKWAEFARVMKEKLGFEFFDFLSCIDWKDSPYGRSLSSAVDIELGNTEQEPPAEALSTGVAGGDTRFQMIARVYSIKHNVGITVKADLGESMAIESWAGIFHGAAWHEREAYEMFGVSFQGHDNLRNIYLPTGFEGNPLRKDYPLMARLVKPWPGIVDVEPMPEVAEPAKTTPSGASTQNPDAGGAP